MAVDAISPVRKTAPVETDEALEAGYGARTPSGDNILNDFARGEAAAYTSLAHARGERVASNPELGLELTDGASGSVFGNVVCLTRPLAAAEWEPAVEVMHNFYAGHPGGPFLVMSGWPTPDLRDRGFGAIGHPPLMYRPHSPVPPADVAGLEIRAVTDGDAATVYEDVFVHAYPVPELQPFSPGCFLPAPALDVEQWRHWVGYLDGAPVATASAFTHDTLVHVEFISARSACRGRGVGAAMTAMATAHDRLPAALIASDLGRSVYERLGYVTFLRYTLWAGHRRP